jgi:hypothetical protein
MKTSSLFIFVLFFTVYVRAQNDSIKISPFQLSLFYPIGTAGISSADNGYIISLNLLTGITGAVQGMEIGGIANINRKYNRGAQVAGICNISGSYSYGAEVAGICNINGGGSTGAQAGGLGNIVGNSVCGLQVGGLFNIVGGSVNGAQFSGITNMNGGKTNGLEAAGILNGNTDSVTGAQIAGVVNSALVINGFQVAGVVNLSGNSNACQIAGVSNLTAGKGVFQIAGVGNIAGDVEGIQIGGVFNAAGTVKGVQLAGVINICDSIDGVPIALISIVKKNGYRRFELWGSEAFYMNFSYKIGIRELYSIISIGYKTGERHNNTGLGFGLGTEMQLNRFNSIDLEGYFYQISHYLWMNEDNFLYSLKLNYARIFNERIALFIGPAFNILSSRINSDVHDIAPGYGVEYKSSYDWKYWLGFNAGIRF